MSYEIGIDVGGTFTDGVILDSTGAPRIVKVPTVPSNLSETIFNIVSKAAGLNGQGIEDFLPGVSRLTYGTTLATNLLVEGNVAKVGLMITRGFADTLRIANMGREYLGVDLNCDRFMPLLSRRQIWEVTERIDRGGRVIIPIRVGDIETGVGYFEESGVEAIAVCFLWGFKNPAHEKQASAIVRKLAPKTFLSVGHEVAPILGEYERSVATVMNAMLGPPVRRDFSGFRERVQNKGLSVNPLILQSSGGVVPVERAISFPVALIGSGPAGGVTAALSLSRKLGIPNVICADMGGTSLDVCLIQKGVADTRLRTRIMGHTLASPMLDVYSIGAGGGSIAWVDGGQRLKVGPRSSGSVPGPVCYGRGGEEPTVTDANLILGRLSPAGLAGGDLPLDVDSAAKNMRTRIGNPLGMDEYEASLGICAIVDNNMANAVRVITVQKGIDPRDFSLVAYGGAGPLHAASFADELGISEVVVPFFAPVFSAYGAVTSNVVHSLAKDLSLELASLDELGRCFVELEGEGRKLLEGGGSGGDNILFRRSAEMRYVGQWHEVSVPMTSPLGSVEDIREIFERTYSAHYGRGSTHSGISLEVISARVDAVSKVSQKIPSVRSFCASQGALKGYREVVFSKAGEKHRTPIYRGEALRPEDLVPGGAIVEYYGTTVLVPAKWSAAVDRRSNLRLRKVVSHG